MEKIRIVADTSTDLTFEEAKAYGIELFSIPLFVDKYIYRDGVDFTHDEFYELLDKSEQIPTTSHIPLDTTKSAYLSAYQAGCEAIIHVCNNSANSGMFNTANLARKMFFDEHPDAEGVFRIEPVDSHTFSLGYGLPAILGAKKRAEGGTVDEILEVMNDAINSIEIYLTLYDLRFARNSGRISAASAVVGSLLGIRPVMSMIMGETENVAKVRGDKNVIPKMVEIVKDRMVGEPFFCIAAGRPVENAKALEKALEEELGIKSFGFFRLGAAVSINAGPDAIAVFIIGKDRRVKDDTPAEAAGNSAENARPADGEDPAVDVETPAAPAPENSHESAAAEVSSAASKTPAPAGTDNNNSAVTDKPADESVPAVSEPAKKGRLTREERRAQREAEKAAKAAEKAAKKEARSAARDKK